MMRFGAAPTVVLAFTAFLPASAQDAISRDELRSAIRSAHSFAAESQVLVEFILRGGSTRTFAQQHTALLQEEIARSAGELDRKTAPPEFADLLNECRGQIRVLAQELSTIRTTSDRETLTAVHARIARISGALSQAAGRL